MGAQGTSAVRGERMPRYQRILLKLSGEVMAGEGSFGLDAGRETHQPGSVTPARGFIEVTCEYDLLESREARQRRPLGAPRRAAQ